MPSESKDKNELLQIREFYNKVAKEYAVEFDKEIDKKPIDQKLITLFIEKVSGFQSKDDAIIYDVGCGSGEIARYINSISFNNHIIIKGLDISEQIIDEARKLNPTIEFVVGDVCNLNIPDSSIDGIVAFYMIVNLSEEQLEMAFSELYRVLKPGGHFLLSFHISDWPEPEKSDHDIHVKQIDELLGVNASLKFFFFSTLFIEELLKKSAFNVDTIITRTPNPSVEYASKRGYIFATKP